MSMGGGGFGKEEKKKAKVESARGHRCQDGDAGD
jgi:hypothetical protein